MNPVRCGVAGSPIAHSLSPVLHRAAYTALGLDWVYDAHDVNETALPGFLAGLEPRWRGLSLTMPLKRAAVDLCDRVETRGALLRSVNTVVLEADGTKAGYNTDVVGMGRALRDAGVGALDTAVVVGGGATAASALAAVAGLGAFAVTILVRSPERAAGLLELAAPLNLDLTLTPWHDAAQVAPGDVVISTVPADGQTETVTATADLAPAVFDVVYAPPVTPLLAAAQRRGATVIGGFELLLHQAARQVELMTGTRTAPVAAMRAAGMQALGSR